MADKKTSKQNTGTEQKVKTKYDLKMEQRRAREAKEKRQEKLLKIGGIAVGLFLICFIAVSIALPIYKKQGAVKDTYVRIGQHDVTRQEFDFYYYQMLNSYSSMYASMGLSAGVDFSGDLSQQQYSDTRTWKDLFDELAVGQLKRVKAITDAAAAEGFTHDTEAEYAEFLESARTEADNGGVTLSVFYRNAYGPYATESSVKRQMKETLLADAYYAKLQEDHAPSEEEITAEYEANKNDYDKVDYRSFTFRADVSEDAGEEEIKAAMDALRTQAEEMQSRLLSGEDFKELCLVYASEEEKSSYEDAESDASLHSGASYAAAPAAVRDWLYEAARRAGDVTVQADESAGSYVVAQFEARSYDENTETTISGNIARERAEAIITELAETYEAVPVKGQLNLQTVSANETE